MKRILEVLFLVGIAIAGPAHAQAAIPTNCQGSWINPITDICWDCAFPMTIGGMPVSNFIPSSASQLDNGSTSGQTACLCGSPPRMGLVVSFWEPVRRADITRTPYCMVSLGGVELNMGVNPPYPVVHKSTSLTDPDTVFYQAHWYIDPVIYWMGAIFGSDCMERRNFDVAYVTELDPFWADDTDSIIFNVESALFANPLAVAACAADCIAASSGFGFSDMFWCSGCQGSIYPLTGNVTHFEGMPATTSLILHRLMAKMTRSALLWQYWGSGALCGPSPELIMDKDGYKYSMLYPVPETQLTAGQCCQPIGRTTILWGMGKSFPVKGEDASYEIFRKRDCCQGAIGFP